MSTPETIYLIPGEYEEGLVWCDDPAPDSYSDPDEAVKYVRADIHESALKRQGSAAKMGMDAAKKDASWREENARRLLAEKCDAPVGWIGPEKYKAACESKMKFFKTIKELREQNEKLQAQVVELVAVAVSVRDDLLLRSEIDSDGTRCVNLSASKWSSFCDVIDEAAKAEGADNAG